MLGVRAYYRDTMGVDKANDVGIYDDAIFLVSHLPMLACNANTDPSRLGWNAGVDKPFAVLQPGLWYFRRGPHKAHPARFASAPMRKRTTSMRQTMENLPSSEAEE